MVSHPLAKRSWTADSGRGSGMSVDRWFAPVPFLCPFLNLQKCGIFCCLSGTEGRLVPWLISVGWQDWQGYRRLCLHSMGSCKRGGLVFPFSQAVSTEVLNGRMIIAAPDQGGRIRLWTKISALAYLALADKCCDKNIPFNWKKVFVNQDKEIVTAFGQCGRGFILS